MNNSNGVAIDNFPDSIEFTFEKKHLLKTSFKKKLANFPLNKFDFPNSKNTGDYNLVFKWNEKTFRDLGSGFVVKTKDMSKNGC